MKLSFLLTLVQKIVLQKLLFALRTQTKDPASYTFREQLLFSQVPHTKQERCRGSRYPIVNKPLPLIDMDNRMKKRVTGVLFNLKQMRCLLETEILSKDFSPEL